MAQQGSRSHRPLPLHAGRGLESPIRLKLEGMTSLNQLWTSLDSRRSGNETAGGGRDLELEGQKKANRCRAVDSPAHNYYKFMKFLEAINAGSPHKRNTRTVHQVNATSFRHGPALLLLDLSPLHLHILVFYPFLFLLLCQVLLQPGQIAPSRASVIFKYVRHFIYR